MELDAVWWSERLYEFAPFCGKDNMSVAGGCLYFDPSLNDLRALRYPENI
jgi:hypothetical protein